MVWRRLSLNFDRKADEPTQEGGTIKPCLCGSFVVEQLHVGLCESGAVQVQSDDIGRPGGPFGVLAIAALE